MNINDTIALIDTAVFVRPLGILCVSDVHLGFEESLHKRGVLTPKTQLAETKERISRIINQTGATRLLINGDLKHLFGHIQDSEWSEVLALFDHITIPLIIVRGNHDRALERIAARTDITVVPYHLEEGYLFAHGDATIPDDTTASSIIIGHDHPAITLTDGIRHERYKCHVVVNANPLTIVQPSFHHITIGSDIREYGLRSPYAQTDSDTWRLYIVDDKGTVADFGTLAQIRAKGL